MNFQLPLIAKLHILDAIKPLKGQAMEADNKILVYGLGVDDPKAMYGTLRDYPELFDSERIFDTLCQKIPWLVMELVWLWVDISLFMFINEPIFIIMHESID